MLVFAQEKKPPSPEGSESSRSVACCQERETQLGERPFRLLERSVFSDRMVFVRTVHEKQWMSDLELNIYDSW